MKRFLLFLYIISGLTLLPVMATADEIEAAGSEISTETQVELNTEAEAEVSAAKSATGIKSFVLIAKLESRITEVWDVGKYEFYVPVYTWHNRFTYDDRKIKRYNELPWGAGLGKRLLDEDGDEHALYAMGFSDSNARFQAIIGYSFFKNFYLDDARNTSLGIGYSLNLTGRYEYLYIPLPLPLPAASFRYRQFAVTTSYVPPLARKNNGNVLFTMVKWAFDF